MISVRSAAPPLPRTARLEVELLEERCLLDANPWAAPGAPFPMPYIQAREEQIATQKGDPRVVFMGDSITDRYQNGPGAGVWNAAVAPLGADDFGVIGYNTANVLWQVARGDLSGIHPQLVVLMIGVNNLLSDATPLQTAEGVAADVQAIHAVQPQAQILLLNILPVRPGPALPRFPDVNGTNALIDGLVNAPYVHHLDVGGALEGPDGSISSSASDDGVHPTAQGYVQLAQAEQGTILSLLVTPQEQAFVSALYQGFLGRPADPAGLTYWGSLLAAGASYQQVADALLNGTEYRTDEVQQLYGSLLGRAADPLGAAYWVAFLQAGGTLRQVEATLLGSDEFFARSGSTGSGFLRNLFNLELGRDPSAGDFSAFGGELTGGSSREAVAAQVLGSGAGLRSLVGAYYQADLGRDASPGNEAAWAPLLAGGQTVESLQAALVGSGEFLGRLNAALGAAGGNPNAAAGRLLQNGFAPLTVRDLLRGPG